MIEHKVSPLFIRLLLERGWNEGLHSQDDKGNTILHHVISVLQDHLQTLNHNGSAIEEENKPVIDQDWFWIEYKYICGALELLLQYGIDPNQQNAEGETPLHQLAAMQNVTQNKYFDRCQSYIASILRENGTQLDLKTNNGKTAIEIAESIPAKTITSTRDIDIIDTLKGKNYISYLPTEVLSNIFKRLPLKSLGNASKVSRQFNNIIQDWWFWMKYLHPHYQALMRDYIERLRKENRDEVQVEQKAGRYLRKVIKEAPYIIRVEYLGLIFQKKYQELQRDLQQSKESLLFGIEDRVVMKSWDEIDLTIILSTLNLRNISLKYSVSLKYFILSIYMERDSIPFRILIDRDRARTISLLILNLPDLWGGFIEKCEQETDIDHTLTQIVLADVRMVIDAETFALDEEVALTFLRHAEFRKFLLEDNTESPEWLLRIFQKSIEYSYYSARGGEPITYKLVGASRLSTALFILEDKGYREKLEKGLRATQDKLEILTRELCNILENSHRSDLKVRTTANSILEKLKLLAPETGRTVMPTTSQHL
jgi:hypothetical protein